MKRRILTALALAALAASAWAMNLRYSSGTAGISVTQANTNTAFSDNHSGGTSSTFNARFVTVCSRSASANSCFFDMDGVATTADYRVAPGACMSLSFAGTSGGDGWAAIGAICATGETATFDIQAGR
jgi:hypothetical protein